MASGHLGPKSNSRNFTCNNAQSKTKMQNQMNPATIEKTKFFFSRKLSMVPLDI